MVQGEAPKHTEVPNFLMSGAAAAAAAATARIFAEVLAVFGIWYSLGLTWMLVRHQLK